MKKSILAVSLLMASFAASADVLINTIEQVCSLPASAIANAVQRNIPCNAMFSGGDYDSTDSAHATFNLEWELNDLVNGYSKYHIPNYAGFTGNDPVNYPLSTHPFNSGTCTIIYMKVDGSTGVLTGSYRWNVTSTSTGNNENGDVNCHFGY